MKATEIQVLKGGLFSTIQDCGRQGWQRFGVPEAGAMDKAALELANFIVGNPANTAGIECTIHGPSLCFKGKAYVAITGADLQAIVNDTPVSRYQLIHIKNGDILSFRGAKQGCRAYIAFAGGLQVPLVMNSASTYLPASFGGHHGRSLIKGDVLHVITPTQVPRAIQLPPIFPSNYALDNPIRILPGPEVSRFDKNAIQQFLNIPFQIHPNSNRVAYRLTGSNIPFDSEHGEIISSGIPFGTIQIPPDGQPIVMMADRPTTGGYPRIAVVASIDHGRLVQLKPGDFIRFREISLLQAQKLLKEKAIQKAHLEKQYFP